uniref:phenylalanine--tRNA ligase n=1 Tax=Dichotomaria marginata TaxID=268567 RepID=A0A1G4NSW1_9FLOR|nr:Phenylalanine-tRNA ligase beta subunit [Dichotomaria marginata]SCW21646.1 Phenylalanine-tRNA ligase beta subunit [Dichotomaria marginata]
MINISWQWLTELLSLNKITFNVLNNKLNLAGFEIENINKKDNGDKIIEISNTSNRLDTTNITGMIKEVSSIISHKINFYKTQNHLKIYRKNLSNNSIYDTIMYGFSAEITIEESPEWLKDKLKLYNINSYNNVLDIINFIKIKWSQEIEIWGCNKIHNQNKQPDTMNESEFIDYLKNYRYKKLWDQLKIKNTNLKNIIIKTEILEINNIKTKINVKSKHENQIYRYNLLEAYNEAIILISYLCKTNIINIHLLSHNKKQFKSILTSDKNINNLLGPCTNKNNIMQGYLKPQRISRILTQLYFLKYNNYQNKNYYIEIPENRVYDVYREIDIIEEISRIYGFDYFIDKIPKNNQIGLKRINKYRIEHIKSILRSLGLSETMHYSIYDQSKKGIQIYNPLTSEHNHLRNNLLSSLLNAYIKNKKNDSPGFNIFEISRIFQMKNELYQESHHMSGIIGGEKYLRNEWQSKPQNLSWFQAKGEIEELFTRLNLNIKWDKPKENFYIYNRLKKYLHPKYTAYLYINKKPIGIFGEIQMSSLLENTYAKIYGFEIAIDPIIVVHLATITFKEYSKYPSIIRDISFNVTNKISFQDIHSLLQTIHNPIIESIYLFDVYTNNSETNKIAIRIIYRANNSTLQTDAVDRLELEIKNYIKKYIKQKFNL